jgi:glycosyltransferase involved in cell wall biosynthesis
MTSDARSHVLHVITGLGDGGAEAVLSLLVTHETTHRHTVISLLDMGKYGPMLKKNGIHVDALDMSPLFPSPLKFARLVRLIHAAKPDIVQTWMYHADLFGGLAARLAGRRVVWGIHSTAKIRLYSKATTRLVIRINALLSRWVPTCIISCSEKGIGVHGAVGYLTDHMVVVANGYDLSVFRPNADGRGRVRAEFGISGNVTLFGCVARFHPHKDHANVLAAFADVAAVRPEVQLMLVGKNMTADNMGVMARVTQHGLDGRVYLVGQRTDIPDVMNAIDLHVLSSIYEAFPNVLSEAMACGTPCVTTDVGDCALIVGETGEVCPPSDVEALRKAMLRMLKRRETEPDLGKACRTRIVERFSLKVMEAGYIAVWKRAKRVKSYG